MLQESIHPRVYYEREKSRIKNTCKRPKEGKTQRLIAAISEHVERHPRDHMSVARIAKLKATL